MKNLDFGRLKPHLIAFAAFAVVAMIFCKPALKGMVLRQGDNIQWRAMYEDIRSVKESTGEQPLWTNNMFSGMPAYQISLEAPNPLSFQHFYTLFTRIFPKPIHFFVLAALCFYFLASVLRLNPYIGMLGGLCYAFATYHPVIISAGHDTKMAAIAFIPLLVGSILMIFDKRYLPGAAVTAMATALMIGANHPQISYYALLIIGFMTVGHIVSSIRGKDFTHLFKSLSIALGAGILGILCNAVVLATTYEYSKESIRGGSVLADKQSPNDRTGLNKDYALSYSLYKSEPLVMMFPRLYGGSTGNLEVSEDGSKAIEALQQMPPELAQQLQGYLQFYWGGISQGTAGPPYSGAIVCFLAILALTFLPNRFKGWMIALTALSFLLSWGSYLEGFNVAMLKHLPFYNKFRAPSMVLVIPTFLFAMAAMMALQDLLFSKVTDQMRKEYRKGLLAVAGVIVLALVVYLGADFTNETDKALKEQVGQIQDAAQREAIMQQVRSFQDGLQEDRKGLFLGDLLRSVFFMAVAGLAIHLYQRRTLGGLAALGIVALASLIDILPIDVKYLNSDNYTEEEELQQAFSPAPYNQEIAKDTGSYRVLDLSQGLSAAFNGNAMTAVFHRSVGGYHAAKLSIYQDLIEKQLYRYPNCKPVLDMLNTRYVIYPDAATNEMRIATNAEAAGDCWLVSGVRTIKEPAKVMSALDSLKVRDEAVIETEFKEAVTRTQGDTVILLSNNHDRLSYKAVSAGGGFAVFSEVYYKPGWKAYVDGKEATIYKTNYVLRGLQIPAGSHEIRFEFKPSSYYGSKTLAVIATGLIWLLLGAAAFMKWKKGKSNGAAA